MQTGLHDFGRKLGQDGEISSFLSVNCCIVDFATVKNHQDDFGAANVTQNNCRFPVEK